MPDAVSASAVAPGAPRTPTASDDAVALWRSGEIEEGIAAFRAALQAHRIAWPETTTALAWRAHWARLRSMWTALPTSPAGAGATGAAHAPATERLDLLWAARLCIGDVDPDRAGWLAATHHQAALAARAADHVAQSLAWDAVDLARADGRAGLVAAHKLLERAERLAPTLRSSAASAWVALARAHVALGAGDFRGGRDSFERAAGLARRVSAGTALFVGLTDTGQAESMAAMGDLVGLRSRWSGWRDAARNRGDRMGEALVNAVVAPRVCLADGDPAAARRALDETELRPGCDRAVAVTGLRLVARCDVDLYAADTEAARAPFDSALRVLRRAGAVRSNALWSMLCYTQGRLALADASSAASTGDPRAVSALEVASEAQSMTEQSANRPARALADTLTAGLAELSGNTMSAAGALRRAQVEFEATHMALHAACCQLVRSWIGDASPRDEAEAVAWMANAGVQDPLRMMRVVLPGLGKRRAPPSRTG
ncbi:MAG: hypothetical protein EXR79_16640 [Myxococcales bacterium]|nr:hypothetical protein [Myxococcales bacterium]